MSVTPLATALRLYAAGPGPFASMDTTVLAGLNLRMLSAIKNAQQQQETSLHLQGVFGRFCAHLCQMRRLHASYMLWDKLCHTSYATQHGRITDSIGQLVSFQGEMYLSRFGWALQQKLPGRNRP